MFIHLEDWSAPMFFAQIEKKGIPHGDTFIKIFASFENPVESFSNKPDLAVFEISGEPFSSDEYFQFSDREPYTGDVLEQDIQALQLTKPGEQVVRALFRFASREDIGIIQNVMRLRNDDGWILQHPFQEIDGIRPSKRYTGEKETSIHIDIYHPSSLAVLRHFIDIDNAENLLSFREGYSLRTRRTHEGSLTRKER